METRTNGHVPVKITLKFPAVENDPKGNGKVTGESEVEHQ